MESRCRLIDDTDGTFTDYYQCGSCKSEHTFAEKNLFQDPNYDFLPVFGNDYTATRRCLPIVSQTEIWETNTQVKFRLERNQFLWYNINQN
ncbi:TPA: hypothetical protein EYP66_18400 [Candidatus Poribacteria bacterium]|nr:hypothetical protein [Candidatus Poribacteria bacterium]